MKNKLIAPLGVLALAGLALAGCASAPTPTPSPSNTAMAVPEIEKKTIVCENDVATVTDNNIEATLEGDCATVNVLASNSIVHLGKVRSLSIEGAINKITTAGADEVSITGNGNLIITPNNPTLSDNGEQNELAKEDNAG
ncbi:DUF3060 domain-containing protein [Leifsonia aquatica]|uniref:DUF3060 domain-containing protein n=1 Tax=Leifsonia aquatica TaxID=144185 RepID=UPI000468C256|nr:DUF3060 domain-containing protein [Leifsonia aquatica]